MGGNVGLHGASFSVDLATRGWLEWSSVLEKTPLQVVEGVLEFKNFWDRNPSVDAVMLTEESVIDVNLITGAKVDFNKVLAFQNLKVSLKGVFVDTCARSRICMTGCACRINHSYQIDCDFHLKMTYPNCQATFPSGQIQAALNRRTTRADDPLRFSTIRIQKDIVPAEYTSMVTYLRSVVEQKNVNYNAHLRRSSTFGTVELVKFQADYNDNTYSGYH